MSSSPEPLDQFQPVLAHGILAWRGRKFYKLGPFSSQKEDDGLFPFLINFICYIHKFFLIWTGFSVERRGPWASCSNILPLIATTVHISFVHVLVCILHEIAISYISIVVVWSLCPHINVCQCLNFYKNLVKWRKHRINSPVIKIP